MSVAENLFIPYEKSGFKGMVNQRALEKAAVPVLERFSIPVQPDELVKDISISSQQLLQIARAVMHENYDVLMLDEPTTSLTTKDTQILFEIVRGIRQQNKAVIFISHKLEEIFALGDVITVFRNGKKVAYSELKDVDIPWVIKQMTGKELDQNQVYYSGKVTDEVLLEVNNLTGERFTDVSFQLKRGEILGFSGLVGAGRSELMQAIFGYLPAYSGSVKLDGENWKLGDPTFSVEHGFIYLPEERKKQGILPVLSIRQNISMAVLDDIKGPFGISGKKEEELAQKVIATYDVKTPDADKEIQFLSGGNQQKVIIGRAMCCNPKVMVFDEPTKGIDVGTKAEIYRLMKELAEEKGIGIILISSEMDEVRKCSNRIIALYEGRKVGEFDTSSDKQEILSAIIGVA
jgi:ribose transport system ATP-binding protein